MKILAPTGFTVYQGATISSAFDATGTLYWVATGRFADDRFGTTVFKQVGEKRSTIVFELPTFCKGRGTISPDGRITAWSELGAEAYTFTIPGFAHVNAGVVIPVTLPSSGGEGSDASARASAAQALSTAKDAAKKAQAALTQAGTALEIANSKPSIDAVWQKVIDGIEAAILHAEQDSNQHLAKFIWQKALDAAYSLLKDRGIITH